MYYVVEKLMKCGSCGEVNNTEIVVRKSEKIIRCCKCGHEKVLETFTNYYQKTETIIYKSEPQTEQEF
jgi:uncharacterized Zn finger protein